MSVGGNALVYKWCRCTACFNKFNAEHMLQRQKQTKDGAPRPAIVICLSPAAVRVQQRQRERERMWGHSKLGKEPKAIAREVLAANNASRALSLQKKQQERADAEAAAAAAQEAADTAAADAAAAAAADDNDYMQPAVANDDDDDTATAGQGQAALPPPMCPSHCPGRQSNAAGKMPVDDDKPARRQRTLASVQRKRKRLEMLCLQKQNQGEVSSKHGEGSSQRNKAKTQSPSKHGEGSSKGDKSPQTPPKSNGAAYADEEADDD